MGRPKAVAALLGAAMWLTPASALAQEGGDDGETLRIAATVGVALLDLGFLAGDLYFGSEGHWMPPHGAWTQLLLVAPANLALGIITLEHGTEGPWLGLGIAELVLGTWFAVHGMLSILGAPDDPPEREGPRVSIAPLEGGALVGLRALL